MHKYIFKCDECGKREEATSDILPSGWSQIRMDIYKKDKPRIGLTINQVNLEFCENCTSFIKNLIIRKYNKRFSQS